MVAKIRNRRYKINNISAVDPTAIKVAKIEITITAKILPKINLTNLLATFSFLMGCFSILLIFTTLPSE
jgi:hypothetical protein